MAEHIQTWVTLNTDKEILSDITGMKIQCDDMPCQHRVAKPLMTRQEQSSIDEEIVKLYHKKVITQVEPQSDQILSGIFFHPKKDGSYRLILNLKQFNTILYRFILVIENICDLSGMTPHLSLHACLMDFHVVLGSLQKSLSHI